MARKERQNKKTPGLMWFESCTPTTTYDKHGMLRFTPYTTTLGLSGLPLNFAVAFIATSAFLVFRV
jgi:hypothetical protein